MASSRNEAQITWSSASSKSVAAGTTEISDEFLFHVEDWNAVVQLYADNSGTPASGDTIDFSIAFTTGDILGDSGNDYDTTEHALPLTKLNTYSTDTPGEDPAMFTVPIETVALGFKIIAKSNAASNSITVRARVVTRRPA